MRVLQVIPYFHPAQTIGGSAQACYLLSRYLISRGHELTVYTTDLGDEGKRNIQLSSVNGITIRYFKNISSTLAYRYHLFITPDFIPVIRKTINRFDLIHLHEIYTVNHWYTARLARKNNIPYILTPHGTAMLAKKEGRVTRKKLFYRLVGRKLLASAAVITALSIQEKAALEKLGFSEDKIQVIPNGIDTGLFSGPCDPSEFRITQNIPSKATVVAFVGRIHPKKGIDLLIRSIASLKNIYLVIAGPTEDRMYAEKLKEMVRKSVVGKRIRFLGAVTGGMKQSLFAAADIFALTSYAEGLPMSVLEAAASGLPLLITKQCGLPQVEEYDAGIIVNNSEVEITGGINKIIDRKYFRKYFGTNAQKMIDKEFDYARIGTRIETLYKSVITKKD